MQLMLSIQPHLVLRANLSKEEERTREQQREANLAEVLPRARERKPVAEARAEALAKVATERSLNLRISGKREPKRTEATGIFCGTPQMLPDFTILV